jgi:DNA processing protein
MLKTMSVDADLQLKFWLGFNRISGIGPAKVQALFGYFGNLQDAWRATARELRLLGFDQRTIDQFLQEREALDLEKNLEQVKSSGVSVLTWESPDYPKPLREISNSPPVLFIRGELRPSDRWAVAVVGTRRRTAYGRQVTRELVAGLAKSGITVVSGLARGIDGEAHLAALDYGGRTIAVLGSGVDQIYPPEHRDLAARIENGRGAVVSDYPLGTEPEARNFPPRNRIISGLSMGVLIIEAGAKSGALITARFAIEQDREVFAVPGNVNSAASQGTNQLIQQGAKLVTRVEDILEELNLQMAVEQADLFAVMPESAEEAVLLGMLTSEPTHIDDLSRTAGMPTSIVSSTLTLLELKGIVQHVGGMSYVRTREPGAVYDAGSSER